MKKLILLPLVLLCMANECCVPPPNSDQVQAQQAEVLLKEGTAQTGMPAIKNFRERNQISGNVLVLIPQQAEPIFS